MKLLNVFTKITLYIISGIVVFLSLSTATNTYYAVLEATIIIAVIIIGDLKGNFIRISKSIGLSITGFIIPFIFSIELILRLFTVFSSVVWDFFIGLIICIIINYLNSITYKKLGVLLLDLLIPLFTISAVSVIIITKNNLDPLIVIPFSIVLGSFSSIIGLDLLNIRREPGKIYVFGGNNVLDAIFLEAFLSPSLSYAILVLSTM